jgi:hypothetical protein
LEIRSWWFVCLSNWPELQSSYFKLPAIAGMTDAYHHTQGFSLEMESCKHFCLGWPRILILPISASLVACGDRCVSPHSAIGWDGLSKSFFAQARLEPWSSWSQPPK